MLFVLISFSTFQYQTTQFSVYYQTVFANWTVSVVAGFYMDILAHENKQRLCQRKDLYPTGIVFYFSLVTEFTIACQTMFIGKELYVKF